MELASKTISINKPILEKIKITEIKIKQLSKQLYEAKNELINLKVSMDQLKSGGANHVLINVCMFSGYRTEEIKGPSRSGPITMARNVIYNIMVNILDYPGELIVASMGRHRTCLYNYKKNHSDWYGSDKLYTKLYTHVKNSVENLNLI